MFNRARGFASFERACPRKSVERCTEIAARDDQPEDQIRMEKTSNPFDPRCMYVWRERDDGAEGGKSPRRPRPAHGQPATGSSTFNVQRSTDPAGSPSAELPENPICVAISVPSGLGRFRLLCTPHPSLLGGSPCLSLGSEPPAATKSFNRSVDQSIVSHSYRSPPLLSNRYIPWPSRARSGALWRLALSWPASIPASSPSNIGACRRERRWGGRRRR